MNHLEIAQDMANEGLGKRTATNWRCGILNALIAIAEELKKANELHSYFEEAIKEDKPITITLQEIKDRYFPNMSLEELRQKPELYTATRINLGSRKEDKDVDE